MAPQSDVQRDLVQVRRADQVSFQFRQTPFGKIGVALEKHVAHQETQDGIAQEFELLVVGSGALGMLLVHRRPVRERAVEQFRTFEAITDSLFQRRPLRAHGLAIQRSYWAAGLAPPAFNLATSAFFAAAMDFTCGSALGALAALSNASLASSSLPASS